jgi:DNA-binding GntR family transcriptional regulator
MNGKQYSSRSTSIVSALKERIIGWEYPPEYSLTEEALCEEFGVSRSPAREALRALATNGFLKKMPNRGYVVKQLNLQEVLEVYELRLALELFVVEQLAERDGPIKEVKNLRQTWTALLNGHPRKGEELAELDTKFHETLAQAVGNRMLLNELRGINERLLVFRMIDFARPERTEDTCHQHLEILARIKAKDILGARTAMQKNIQNGRNVVSLAIKEALAKAYSLEHS